MALSPFMIYYSAEGRAYALMIALVAGASLALLAAAETGRTRWWVVYCLCSLGALYSHYTSVFVLGAMFLWVAWKHRERLRACAFANLAVATGFAPWLPGFAADNDSPTTDILAALQPFDWTQIRLGVEQWSLGYPYAAPAEVPGLFAAWLIVAGVCVAAGAGALRLWQHLRANPASVMEWVNAVPAGAALVTLLVVATPVGEAVFSAFGTDIFAGRNLNASWPGLAVAIGGLLTAAGPLLGVTCAALVIGGYAIGATRTLDEDSEWADYPGVASAIEERWADGDVVVDGAPLTPVPLTGLDAYLPQTNPEIRLGLPSTDEPFMPVDPVPEIEDQIAEAYGLARGHSLFLVASISDSDDAVVDAATVEVGGLAGTLLSEMPRNFKLERKALTFPGVSPLVLLTITDREAP